MEVSLIIGLITVAFVTCGGIAGVVKGMRTKSPALVYAAGALIVFALLSLIPLFLG
jgi:choline-glycine betaine transporter